MFKSKKQRFMFAALLALLVTGLAVLLTSQRQQSPVPVEAVWIDVRSAQEYAQGHLEQAPRIPHDEIEAGVAELGLAKDTPIYLYCAVGGRAGKAKKRLEAQGFTQVVNVGGLEDARRLLAAGEG